jgi:uncharacterized membrane protein HdeD (DUF308 family)
MFAQLSPLWWMFALCAIAAILSRIVAISAVVCGVLVVVYILGIRSPRSEV